MRYNKIILAIILIAFSSCTSTRYVTISDLDVNYEDIDIYFAGIQSPERAYSIIAYVETSGSVLSTKKQLMKSLKRKADILNGDAIIEIIFSYRAWAFSSLPTAAGYIVRYK